MPPKFLFLLFYIVVMALSAGCADKSRLNQQSDKYNNNAPIFPSATSLPNQTPQLSSRSPLPTQAMPTRVPPLQLVAPFATELVSTTIPISFSQPVGHPGWGLSLDDAYVYWVDDSDATAIKRLSLFNPTQPQIVARGTFTQADMAGVVSDIEISDNNRWLVYRDRLSKYPGGDWKLTALNLETLETTVILEANGVPFETVAIPSSSMLWLAVGANEVVITYMLLPDKNECQRIVTRVIELDTMDNQIIAETDCAKAADILLWPQIDAAQMVAEQDRVGGEVNIILHHLQTGVTEQITSDQNSTAPQISSRFVIWKRGYRSEYGNSIGIYDLQTAQTTIVDFPTLFPQPKLNEHWMYWCPAPFQSLYLYDLVQNQFILVMDSENCNRPFSDVTMKGTIVAWIRDAQLNAGRVLE